MAHVFSIACDYHEKYNDVPGRHVGSLVRDHHSISQNKDHILKQPGFHGSSRIGNRGSFFGFVGIQGDMKIGEITGGSKKSHSRKIPRDDVFFFLPTNLPSKSTIPWHILS